MKQGPLRRAIVTSGEGMTELRRAVTAYLPENYRIVRSLPRDDPLLRNLYIPERSSSVLISGHDVAGWTLDGYVIPRLRSGLRFATEVMPAGRSRRRRGPWHSHPTHPYSHPVSTHHRRAR